MATMTKMDPNQIQRTVFDEDTQSNRVSIVSTEMGIELSAEDGDSVLTQKTMTTLEVAAGEQFDTSKASKICVLSEDPALDHVIATACVAGKEVTMAALGLGEAKSICVPALKLSHDCIVILQS